MSIASAEKAMMREQVFAFTPAEKEKLKKLLADYKEEGPRPADFDGIYPDSEIIADTEKIEKTALDFQARRTTEENELAFYASALEMVINQFANAWLGGSFSKASDYDDFFNGTDLVYEIHEHGEVLRVALDVTTGFEQAAGKIKQIETDLKMGRFTNLKYFESQLDDMKGKCEMPRFIIGADRVEIVELCRLYLDFICQKGENKSKKGEEIRNHRLGSEIMNMISIQLDGAMDTLKGVAGQEQKIETIKKIMRFINLIPKENASGLGGKNGIQDAVRYVIGASHERK